MKQKNNAKWKRLLALIVCFCMLIMTVVNNNISAKEVVSDSNLCQHHPKHTAECGYVEATEGSPCTHEHSDDCYVTDCTHVHTADCYSDGGIPEEGEEKEADACTHECSEESGCVTLACTHEHDAECGYVEATEGSPCTYVCEICNAQDSEETKGEAKDAEADAEKDAADADFTINGAAAENTFEYADDTLEMKVTASGEAKYDGELKEETESVKPEISVDSLSKNNKLYREIKEYAKNGEDASELLGLETMKLTFSIDGKKLDMSGCKLTAEVSLTEKALKKLQKKAEAASEKVASKTKGSTKDDISETMVLTALQADSKDIVDVDTVSVDSETTTSPTMSYSLSNGDIMAITVETMVDPEYTIQHYFWFPQVVHGQTEPKALTTTNALSKLTNQIPFIDTDVGKRSNGYDEKAKHNYGSLSLSNTLSQQTLIADLEDDATEGTEGTLKTKKTLSRLFADEDTSYQENPQINYMSRLYNNTSDYNQNYTLEQIWVYQPESGSKTPADTDFVVYNVPSGEVDDTVVHYPERIRFTNNPANSHLTIKPTVEGGKTYDQNVDDATTLEEGKDGTKQKVVKESHSYTTNYPYAYTILIQQGTIVRFVFDTTTGESSPQDAEFYDYDITDGYIYDSATRNNPKPTSSQTDDIWYAYTNRSGINSGDATTYAFGNKNTNMGKDTYDYNIYHSGVYGGCTFGMVNGILNGVPQWSGGISAPAVFGSGPAAGKTIYKNDYKLKFDRDGGTYTLKSVLNGQDEVASNLQVMQKTYENTDSKTSTFGRKIYSNEFWPMDGAASHGTDGHDLKFGRHDIGSNRIHFGYGGNATFPTSDVTADGGKDHNAYFGMSYDVDFTIDPGYCAPLEYWFYGDDDMWVFLQKQDKDGNWTDTKLIADIGGVHSSVGEYVNLWDYVEPVPYTYVENGKTCESKPQAYRMTIFYTERGASGSTCYTRFSVPLNSKVEKAPDRDEAIVIEKRLLNDSGEIKPYEEDKC